MMRRDRDPAPLPGNHPMTRHEVFPLVDRQLAVEREPDLDRAAGHVGGHAVAAAADVNVGLPARLPDLAVGGVIAVSRQRVKRSATISWTVPWRR